MNYKDFFKEDVLSGGKGDKTTSKDLNQKELAMGIKVEKEHSKSEKVAKEIATDHLTEDPYYYSKLKKADLADELKEDVAVAGINNQPTVDSNAPPENVESNIVEPDTQSVDKQTTQGTVFPPVNDPMKGPDMGGCIGSTNSIETKDKTDVDSPTKDPSATDHVTGGMSSTPVNPNILSKSNGHNQSDSLSPVMTAMAKTIVPQDISIDIAESKRLLNKLMKEVTVGPKNAFGLKKVSNENESDQPEISKEGYGGDPDTDPKYVKGKRWTLKWNNQ